MKRSVIIKNILTYLLDKYSRLDKESDEYKDIDDDINDEKWTEAINGLKSLSTTSKFHPLLTKILSFTSDIIILNEDLNYGSNKRDFFVKYDKECYRRLFVYYSPTLIVADTSMFYKDNIDDNIWRAIEHACYDTSKYKQILDEIHTRNKGNTYFIEYAKTIYSNARSKKQELYSYALSLYLSEGNILEVPNIIKMNSSWPPRTSCSFIYKKDIIYKEFFDIYDAINDWFHSKDIITAFIKMYQIIEYMIYRMQMSEIVKKSSIKQSFLRESKNLSKKYSDGEKKTIIENIPKLFPGLTLSAPDINNAHGFLDKYFEHTKSGNVYLTSTLTSKDLEVAIAKFIYDVRCCIVHNKEAEFHILYNNYEEYESIIPLMNEINRQMVDKIFNIINTINSDIHYTTPSLELY